MDTFSKSDPVVFVYEMVAPSKSWVLKGKTEIIQNNLNPDFKTPIVLGYSFEKHQSLKFEVRDDDGGGKFDEIGVVETSVGNIMGARAQTFATELLHKGKAAKRGQIIVRAESIAESNTFANLTIAMESVPNNAGGCLGFCRSIVPVHYEIVRSSAGNATVFNHVVSSNVVQNTNDPVFKP